MRISDTQFSQMMLQSLQSNNAGLGEVLQQMSTGKRLTKLSDAPIDSIKLLNLEREGQALDQYRNNISNVKTTLSSQETYLDAANESLKSMRDLVLWGANESLSEDDRIGIVTELESLRDSLVSTFNAQDEEGNYLFSGTQTDQPSLVAAGSDYVINGNNDKRVVTVAKGVTMESNVTAGEILELGGDNIINRIDKVIAEFKQPTAAFHDEVNSALNAVDATLSNVLEAMTTIGGRQNNLDLLENSHSENKLFVDKVSGDLEALDYGEASVRLNNYISALQATQASYMKINELSLFGQL
ncbi:MULTISPECIES: flagellar hook-associated protein FlgL [Photobacterium]|uniref:Flagellar hook protein FlgL n=1 Tax=Photobacterium ganghwense TaxID=320778 RepID=A0A0J1K6L7_9GAMM|nr:MULTISPECIES: flagellar hook-associated protein FlgL [Photobacterium]KLV09992.1 flagellar hook protein FlgL [Photobacterium ganghwense]MBV1841754.1 flagellar hook-associated protein FlgL [Photobacterium ganghwense]PSU09155.1 flagellar hook-associated protein 3 [Photobacterium ganghwense]